MFKYLQLNADNSFNLWGLPISISITSPLIIGLIIFPSRSILFSIFCVSVWIDANRPESISFSANANSLIYALKSSILTSTLAETI